MERTRDLSLKSIASSDVRSILSFSSNSQTSDKTYGQCTVETPSIMLPLLYEAINETIAEKTARAKEISELLRLFEIDPKSLPKNIQHLWTKAAAIIGAEGLSNLNQVTLTLHMHRKMRENINKAREERKFKARFNHLQMRQSDVLEKNNHAQDSIDMLQKILEEESNNDELYINRMTDAVKLNDYKELNAKTEESLKMLGAINCSPDKILDKYKNYLELQEELKRVDDSLCKYSDLPPNLSEAKVKLAEKEKYLKNLDHAIFEKMK